MIALGLDGMKFLKTRDSFDRNMMNKLAELVYKEREKLDHQLANRIAAEVSKLFKK